MSIYTKYNISLQNNGSLFSYDGENPNIIHLVKDSSLFEGSASNNKIRENLEFVYDNIQYILFFKLISGYGVNCYC